MSILIENESEHLEASQVTSVVKKKNLPTNAGDVGSLEEGMTTAPVFLPADPHRQRSLVGGLQPVES